MQLCTAVGAYRPRLVLRARSSCETPGAWPPAGSSPEGVKAAAGRCGCALRRGSCPWCWPLCAPPPGRPARPHCGAAALEGAGKHGACALRRPLASETTAENPGEAGSGQRGPAWTPGPLQGSACGLSQAALCFMLRVKSSSHAHPPYWGPLFTPTPAPLAHTNPPVADNPSFTHCFFSLRPEHTHSSSRLPSAPHTTGANPGTPLPAPSPLWPWCLPFPATSPAAAFSLTTHSPGVPPCPVLSK